VKGTIGFTIISQFADRFKTPFPLVQV